MGKFKAIWLPAVDNIIPERNYSCDGAVVLPVGNAENKTKKVTELFRIFIL